MGSNFFFSFGGKLASANAQVSAVGLEVNENRINYHFKLVKGEFEGMAFPVVFQQQYKGKFNDILDTGSVSLYLISENMKKVLEDNELTGWKVFPIRLFDLKGNEMDGYYGFSIVGRCGRVSYDQSEIKEKRMVPQGPLFQYYKGISFDRWDSSDFFIPEKTAHIFITKKAAEILKKNKISNMSLVNLADLETDVDIIKNYK